MLPLYPSPCPSLVDPIVFLFQNIDEMKARTSVIWNIDLFIGCMHARGLLRLSRFGNPDGIAYVHWASFGAFCAAVLAVSPIGACADLDKGIFSVCPILAGLKTCIDRSPRGLGDDSGRLCAQPPFSIVRTHSHAFRIRSELRLSCSHDVGLLSPRNHHCARAGVQHGQPGHARHRRRRIRCPVRLDMSARHQQQRQHGLWIGQAALLTPR
jgi:hypothetical protein